MRYLAFFWCLAKISLAVCLTPIFFLGHVHWLHLFLLRLLLWVFLRLMMTLLEFHSYIRDLPLPGSPGFLLLARCLLPVRLDLLLLQVEESLSRMFLVPIRLMRLGSLLHHCRCIDRRVCLIFLWLLRCRTPRTWVQEPKNFPYPRFQGNETPF